jgi:hypothetical protein
MSMTLLIGMVRACGMRGGGGGWGSSHTSTEKQSWTRPSTVERVDSSSRVELKSRGKSSPRKIQWLGETSGNRL